MSRVDLIELTEADSQPIAWHAVAEEIVYTRLQTSLSGLDPQQVKERLEEFGRNTLPEPQPPTLLEVILHQFKSPLIYILLIAALIAILSGDMKDALFIFGVLALNAAIGTAQEWRAEQSAHALKQLLKIQARVRREGQQFYIDAEELVPGDVVLLESGDKVPADLRLAQVNSLSIDESFLTGESMAAVKNVETLKRKTPVSDRRNMAYAGSTVMSGRGVGLVVATGRYTEVGKIARTVAEEKSAKPPLVQRMERFARQISFVVLGFASLLGVVSLARGMPLDDVILLVIAMAVSAIPEGLPVAMTVALSLSTSRMVKRNVIVRRLNAVESLGSCTIIASDKTGTLTVNQQTVRLIVFPEGCRVAVSGEGYNNEGQAVMAEGGEAPPDLRRRLEELARSGCLCNEAALLQRSGVWTHSGDAMDVALLALGYKLGCDPDEARRQYPALHTIPFESEKRYAAALHQMGEGGLLIVKGAVESVLPFCTQMRAAGGDVELDAKKINRQALAMAEEGYRVLAFAVRQVARPQKIDRLDESHLKGMSLLGLAGFIDPQRPEARAAVQTACQAGIKVVMITGDHPATAFAIARQLGIAETKKQVVTGQELAEIGGAHVPEFYERVKHASVFARVSPEQKYHIVEALMALGHFIAVTGDGVNDAPALRKANIGVAMGSGTEIAKDTASLIVTDDNFASIVAGIEEGRHAYANVRKVTLFLISTGLAELLMIGLSVAAGLPIPLLAIQILWLNMVTNGIQDVALAFESGEPGVMKDPPRPPAEGIFNRKMIEQVVSTALVMALVCFGAWAWMLNNGWEESAARSALLTLLALMQFYHAFNCRSEKVSALRVPLRNNPFLIVGMALALIVHALATELPFLQSLLRTQPLPLNGWLLFALLAASILLTAEAYKALSARRRG